jgi:D-alanyl-D-alanine dipeptidase
MKQKIIHVLPRSVWGNITIKESNEPLVELQETARLRFATGLKHYTPTFFIREGVAEKLYRVAESLPKEFTLLVIECFRSTESQQQEWDRVFAEIKRETKLPDDEVEKRVRLLVAKPLPLANHHCGGAVDLTLCYADGTPVDMGTPYISQIKDMSLRDKIPMLSNGITDEAQYFRNVLRKHMEAEDFVWYPGEWWHYCYGDRMWAVYSGKIECFYGSVEEL